MRQKKFKSPNADLSERYTIVQQEGEWQVGHVVCVNRDITIDADVEISQEVGSPIVIGVISADPAFSMNSDLEDAVDVALKGRVPCFVQGPIEKGKLLISGENGIAVEYIGNDNDSNNGEGIGNDPEDDNGPARIFAVTNDYIEDPIVDLIEIILL